MRATVRLPVRVAVDLRGGDRSAGIVAAGALLAASERPDLEVILVGPGDGLPCAGRLGDRVTVVPAPDGVEMDEDPVPAVRARRGASVRVAAQLVRDGRADAMVTVGSTGAATAAALLTLGRLPGTTRPGLAAVVPAMAHPVVLLDAGASPDVTPDVLAQYAVAGAAYARSRLRLAEPRVGLLSIGAEAGKGDGLRREAHAAVAAALAGLAVRFVGNVEGCDVPLGGPADVVVTDGFSGNVLLKGLEGTYQLVTSLVGDALAARGVPAVDRSAVGDPLHRERWGGAVLLGVRGIVVVGHGASTERAVAACIEQAAGAVRDGVLGGVEAGLAELAARRRVAVGLPVTRSPGR
ncbi:MAG: phosphate acyltransferase PlsX [Frankiaceae bacterium]